MDIESKSFFTYIDISMDHFKTPFEVREKYLRWLFDYFELSEDIEKKWSRVGKGIDYYTFKKWVAKENRFQFSNTKLSVKSFKMNSHYHEVESVVDKIQENSYEDKLKFYYALSLLSLVDKKCIMPRIEFIKWTALVIELDEEDCAIVRDHVVEEFDLSFDINNLKLNEKEDIFLRGVQMAHLSGDIIDNREAEFLNNLKNKLGANFINFENDYFLNYLIGDFSSNKKHSKLAIHKIGAVLLSIIGSDNDIDKREGKWFKKNFSSLDNILLSELLSNNVTTLIDAMNNEDKALCYILGIDVALRDDVLHKNEVFWLEYLYESISKDFKFHRDLSMLLYECMNRNSIHIQKNYKVFHQLKNFLPLEGSSSHAGWKFIKKLFDEEVTSFDLSKFFFDNAYNLNKNEQAHELVYLSDFLYSNQYTLPKGLNSIIKERHPASSLGDYGQMLICEILKISLLDDHIDNLEDDLLRTIQYQFKITEKQLHRVLFITAFIIGKSVDLSPRVNYSYL